MSEQTHAARSNRATRFTTGIFVLLCLTVFLAVAAYGAVDSLALSFLALFSFVIVLLWSAEAFAGGSLRYSKSLLQFPILGLIVIGLIQILPIGPAGEAGAILSVPSSSALSLDPYATRIFTVRLLLLLVFFAAALAFMNSAGRVRKLVIFLITFGTLIGFFGILQKLSDPGAIYGLRPTPQAIPFGPYVNQHHFASLMIMLLGPTVGLLTTGGVRRDVLPLLWIATAMMAVAVFFTGSRGGVLSLAAMVGFVLLMSGRNAQVGNRPGGPSRFQTVGKFAGAAVLVLAIVGIVLFLGAGENMLRGLGLGSGVADDVSSGRLHFWQIALKIFLSHPIIGSGLDSFGVAFTAFDTRNGFFRVEQAHNDYLQILADAGLLGLACVVAFVVLLLKWGMNAAAKASTKLDLGIRIGALAGCIGVLVHSFFDFPLRTAANGYVFLLLVVLATQTITAGTDARRRTSGH